MSSYYFFLSFLFFFCCCLGQHITKTYSGSYTTQSSQIRLKISAPNHYVLAKSAEEWNEWVFPDHLSSIRLLFHQMVVVGTDHFLHRSEEGLLILKVFHLLSPIDTLNIFLSSFLNDSEPIFDIFWSSHWMTPILKKIFSPKDCYFQVAVCLSLSFFSKLSARSLSDFDIKITSISFKHLVLRTTLSIAFPSFKH